jgi:hypothetical protein
LILCQSVAVVSGLECGDVEGGGWLRDCRLGWWYTRDNLEPTSCFVRD